MPPLAPGTAAFSVVEIALRRPYTFIVMAMLILLATPLVLKNMATDIFPEIDIPVISMIWNYKGCRPRKWACASPGRPSAASPPR